MTLIMIYIVVLGVGLKCPLKIHLNTQWEGRGRPQVPTALIQSSHLVIERTKMDELHRLKKPVATAILHHMCILKKSIETLVLYRYYLGIARVRC